MQKLVIDTLQAAHPSVQRGLSARSVRRFCSTRGISKRTNAELDAIVSETVSQVNLLHVWYYRIYRTIASSGQTKCSNAVAETSL